MTAEIALLNKTAVALAADSAMTIQSAGKIYPAEKLFALTRHQPVGVMFYNNAEFMGVPWETIIKMYRAHIGTAAKATCKEYLQDFLNFVRTHPACTPNQTSANLQGIALDGHNQILIDVHEQVTNMFRQRKHYSKQAENRVIKMAVDRQLAVLQMAGESESMESVKVRNIVTEHRDMVDQLIDRSFQKFELTQFNRKALHKVFQLSITSSKLSNNYSGVVIAGFGENEMFPTLYCMETDGIVGGVLKHSPPVVKDIDRAGLPAAIVSFAQREMVDRFMGGIDPDFLRYLKISFREQLYLFGEGILNVFGPTNAQNLQSLRESANAKSSEFFELAEQFQETNFVGPIMSIVRHLPKEELGGMAEALVNLTSLKRRVSQDQETVGGPVDVAIISKGDGFIWMRRKHYFDPALNVHYINNQTAIHRKGETT